MAKTVLGRGLGHLMNGAKPADSPETPGLPFSDGGESSSQSVGPGLGKLLQGRPKEGSAAVPPETSVTPASESHPPPAHSLRWALVAADALLLILASWVAVTRKGRMGAWEVLLCAAALGLGAWLSCAAFLMFRRRP